MATTAQKPKKAEPHNEFKHGPFAVAFNASVGTLALTAAGKASGAVPPWTALVAGIVLAGCVFAAGQHRQPRPLSRVSLAFRVMVVLAAAVWMWLQLATFPPTGLTRSQLNALLIAWPGAVLLGGFAAAARRVPLLIRLLAPFVVFSFAVVLTLVQGDHVFAWLHDSMTVVDRLHKPDVLPWVGTSIITLAIMAGPLAVLGVTFANRERNADEEAAARALRDLPRTEQGAAKAFQRLVCRLSNEYTEHRPEDPTLPGWRTPNLGVTRVVFWDNGAGETYIIDLRHNERGTTRERLRSYAEGIGTKLNLPHGCGVEVLPAKDDAGETMGMGFAAVDVSRVNVLKNDIPYPAIQQRSILNAMPLGRTRSNKEIGPYFRESSAYVWGQKGSGKTGTIYDIIAGALQCTDCLVWVIDLNRGNAARPFLRAWANGDVHRPCVDWVATTLTEVVLMAQVGLAIALARKNHYADLKFELDTNLMPVGNGAPGQPPPEVLIVIDEGATVLGIGGGQMTPEGRAARDALNQIMDLARDAAVNIVFSGLRATSDVADTAFKAGTAVRIGMRVTDDAELAHGFGDWKLSGSQIPYKGSGYICTGHDEAEIQVFKAYYLAPKRLAEIGEQVTGWRPYLDEPSLRTAGHHYANRWRRAAPTLWDNPRDEVLNYGAVGGYTGPVIDGSVVDPAAGGGVATAVAAPPVEPSVDAGAVPTGEGFEGMMAAARRRRQRQQEFEDNMRAAGGDPPAGGGDPPPPPPDDPPPPAEPEPAAPAPGPPPPPATTADVRRRFDDITTNMTVLDADPHARRMSPDEEIASASPHSREILERMVRLYGPLPFANLYTMLVTGGDWGPAVRNDQGAPISKVAVYKLLKDPRTKEPVSWLAPREDGEPYNHRDKLSG